MNLSALVRFSQQDVYTSLTILGCTVNCRFRFAGCPLIHCDFVSLVESRSHIIHAIPNEKMTAKNDLQTEYIYQRTIGPVNAHLISYRHDRNMRFSSKLNYALFCILKGHISLKLCFIAVGSTYLNFNECII